MTLFVDISKAYEGITLTARFEAPSGITVLFGPSGSGKTSLINAVAGLARPDAGRITLEGQPLFDSAARKHLPPHKRQLGYVFQSARLFPHLTVAQNLRFARIVAGEAEFDRITELLGLGALLTRRPATLSGGEAQRVSLGRALLSKPRLLLADEPLSALDARRKSELLPYFERLRAEAGIPILYVTHSVSELARLADQVVTFEQGTASAPRSPADVLADPALVPGGAAGVGSLIEAEVAAHHTDGLTELSAGGAALFVPLIAAPAGTPLRLRIAASDVTLALERPENISALNILPCTVAGLRKGEGPGTMVTLTSRAGTLHARVTRRSADAMQLAEGTKLHAIVKTVSIAREDVGG